MEKNFYTYIIIIYYLLFIEAVGCMGTSRREHPNLIINISDLHGDDWKAASR